VLQYVAVCCRDWSGDGGEEKLGGQQEEKCSNRRRRTSGRGDVVGEYRKEGGKAHTHTI